MFHVPKTGRIILGPMSSTADDGNNGYFEVFINQKSFAVIASDGWGWEHVSVSLPNRCPAWEEMCKIKDIFWDGEDCVVQYHPPRSEYRNVHPYCLHLWRPINQQIPRPLPIMVG